MMEPIIKVVQTQMQSQIEDAVFNAVVNVGVDVDKERLIKALTDAKQFYHEGYEAGLRDATPRARWVDRYSGKYANHFYECSECGGGALYEFKRDLMGHDHPVQVLSDACPHCGAKMDEEGF